MAAPAGATPGEPGFPSIGERVVDVNGFRATVRYVGHVSTAKDPTSVWIGESRHVRNVFVSIVRQYAYCVITRQLCFVDVLR